MAACLTTTEKSESSDTSAEPSLGIRHEISLLKEKFGPNCRVIDNIGEFLHVISITFQEWNVKIKLQISGGYPAVPAGVVVSDDLSGTESSTSDLNQFLQSKRHVAASITGCVEMAYQWLSENYVTGVSAEAQRLASKKKKTKKTKVSGADEDKSHSKKKPSMKTADDVIKRILWDSNVNQEDFIIGYVDRFLGLMEKSFTNFSWEDIASVDDFTALAIPRHRIQYFKYRGVIVWDKTKRLDNVFGSTGSGLTLSEMKEQIENGRHPIAEVVNGSSDGESDDDSDEDDSDIEVKFSVSACKPNHNKLSDGQQNDGEVSGRKRPNYFVCVRITSPEIIANVQAMQSSITTIDPRFINCYSNSTTLHLTVCTVGLDTEFQIRNACQALQENHSTLAEIARRGITFQVSGVDHFYGRVVYAKVKPNAGLDEFVTRVRGTLTDAGVEIRDGYDYLPHVTILKLSRTMDHAVGVNRLPPFIYQNFKDMNFGVQRVESIDLCAMTHERSEAGYYMSPLHLDVLSEV